MKEALNIKSIDGKLTTDEKKIRRFVMNSIIDDQQVFNIQQEKENLCNTVGVSTEKYDDIIERLIEKNVIAVDDGNINFIYPVSGFPTNHKVTLADGRSFSAMCGIDAMGAAYVFKSSVTVDSCCAACGEPIKIEVTDGALEHYRPHEAQVLHVDLDKHDNWSGNC